MRGTSMEPPTTSSGSSAHTFRTKLAKLLLGSLVAQYGNASSVPQHEIDAVRLLYPQADCDCALKEAEHLWMRAAAKAASSTESAPAGIARTARRPQTAGPSLTSPRLHAYIHGRTNAEARRLSLRRRAVEDSQNLRRVLNEIQQRMPSLRKLAQQRNIDLDTEEGQVAGFADIFTLIDEDGSGGVTAEEFIAFGRRVGGESARVFSRELFSRVDRQAYEKSKSDTDGGISKEQFIAVLFPRYWARKRQQQEELRRREEAAQAPPACRHSRRHGGYEKDLWVVRCRWERSYRCERLASCVPAKRQSGGWRSLQPASHAKSRRRGS